MSTTALLPLPLPTPRPPYLPLQPLLTLAPALILSMPLLLPPPLTPTPTPTPTPTLTLTLAPTTWHTHPSCTVTYATTPDPQMEALLSIWGCKIKTLNLEEMAIHDPTAQALAYSMVGIRPGCLTSLNLSHNQISDAGATALARHLDTNKVLKHLDVSWNKIGHLGGVALSESLLSPDCKLRSLDLSWNALGSSRDRDRVCAASLAAALETNSTLTHTSISHNNFTPDDFALIAAALAKNHTIMGFHSDGGATVDSRGFVVTHGQVQERSAAGADEEEAEGAAGEGGEGPSEAHDTRSVGQRESPGAGTGEVWDGHTSHIFTRILRSKVRGREKWAPESNCWICEKWSEHEFRWEHPAPGFGTSITGTVASNRRSDLQICLNFDHWEPHKMPPAEDDGADGGGGADGGAHVLWRMVPPGQIFFCFLVDGVPATSSVYETVATDSLKIPPQTTNRLRFELPPELNVLEVEEADEDDEIFGVKPRHQHHHHAPKHHKKRQSVFHVWSFESSVFAKYQQDTDELLEEACEADFIRSNIAKNRALKDKPAELLKVKEVLTRHYAVFKNVFRHYGAAYSSEVFNLGANACNEILTASKILESGKTGCNRTEADMVFIAASVTGPKNNKLNPKRALCRYQFLEMMTSLAITKFYKSGRCESPAEAVEEFATYCLGRAEFDRGQEFREGVLYNQEVDDVFKANWVQLGDIFARFGGKDCMMDIDEWTYLMKVSALLEGTTFSERMCNLCFVRALQTSVDELDDGGKHRNMTMIEFIEATARVAQHRMECLAGDHDEEKPLAEHIQECVTMMTAALPQAPKIAPVKTTRSQRQLKQVPGSSKSLLPGAEGGGASTKRGGGGFGAIAAAAMRA